MEMLGRERLFAMLGAVFCVTRQGADDDEDWGAEKAGVQMFATVPGQRFKYSTAR